MKLERMLSIITYLLNHKKVKAQELADKFEVSVRTIYRDIDAISISGIPIVTYQGVDGGIGIVEGFKLDKSVLTSDEVFSILAGLKGLHSISGDIKTKLLIEKLSGIAESTGYMPVGNEVLIDLSPWNKNNQLISNINQIKDAIQKRKILEFKYYSATSEAMLQNRFSPQPEGSEAFIAFRKVEPCVMVFKESNWYLYAFCLLRQDFRFFKLSRIMGFQVTDEFFEPREFSLDDVIWDGKFDHDKHQTITIVFEKDMKNKVNDIFGMESFSILPDGRYKVEFNCGLDEWLIGFLLGFGDKAEVLEPPELRKILKGIAESVKNIYSASET